MYSTIPAAVTGADVTSVTVVVVHSNNIYKIKYYKLCWEIFTSACCLIKKEDILWKTN
jgi:hypothetical protein